MIYHVVSYEAWPTSTVKNDVTTLIHDADI